MALNRRIAPRIALNVQVEYEGFERFNPDRTLNLGPGGVFVVTPKPLPIGKAVAIRLELPELAKNITARGTVTWTPARSSKRHPSGMAIRFDHNDVETLRLIDEYVTVETGLRTVDKRVGNELPGHIRKELSPVDGDAMVITFSGIESIVDI